MYTTIIYHLLSRSNNSIKINDTKIHSQFYSNN